MPGDSIRWLLVSKPLRTPFDDGSTVLVRDLVASLPQERLVSYFGDPNHPIRDTEVDIVVDKAPMGHAPGMMAKVGVLTALMAPARRKQPLHFFFTPNKVTSSVLSNLRRLQPKRPMVQSLMSSHGAEKHVPLLRPLDAIVVLSDHTARQLEAGGLDPARIHRIHPGVRLPNAVVRPREDRRMLYAGDLDAAVADRLIAVGRALREPTLADWTLIIACRPKGDDDAAQRGRLKETLAAEIGDGRVEVHGRVDDMPALLRSCSLQLFVADHVKKKVDIPLVILESMALGTGIIAMDFAPLDELFLRAEERELEVGTRVADTRALVRAVVEAAGSEETLAGWAAAARELVAREFSVDAMARAYDALYGAIETR